MARLPWAAVLFLTEPTAGTILFDGQDLASLSGHDLRRMRQRMQVVFQNPLASLNPRLKIFDSVAEPLRTHGSFPSEEILRKRVVDLLQLVGLGEEHLERFPPPAVGRPVPAGRDPPVGLTARSDCAGRADISAGCVGAGPDHQPAGRPATRPRPDLPFHLPRSGRCTAHQPPHRRHVSGQAGRGGASQSVFAEPLHPYTQALLGAIPLPDVDTETELVVLEGNVPSYRSTDGLPLSHPLPVGLRPLPRGGTSPPRPAFRPTARWRAIWSSQRPFDPTQRSRGCPGYLASPACRWLWSHGIPTRRSVAWRMPWFRSA